MELLTKIGQEFFRLKSRPVCSKILLQLKTTDIREILKIKKIEKLTDSIEKTLQKLRK